MEVHERIKSLRIKNGMTQKELGEKLGVSTVSIRHWEAGSKNPSMSAIVSLAGVFKVTTDCLLGVDNSPGKDDILLTKREMMLLSNYRLLDTYGREAVDAICVVEMSRNFKKP